MTDYNIRAEREGKFWLVYINGINGLTQARRYSEIELMAREYISLTTDQDMASVRIASITIAGITDEINRASSERSQARELESAASERVRSAARKLRDSAVPLSEIGQILGVSHQRVHQLVAS